MYIVTQRICYVPTGAKEHKRSKERYVKCFALCCYGHLHFGEEKRGLKVSHSWATFLSRLFKYYTTQILANLHKYPISEDKTDKEKAFSVLGQLCFTGMKCAYEQGSGSPGKGLGSLIPSCIFFLVESGTDFTEFMKYQNVKFLLKKLY